MIGNLSEEMLDLVLETLPVQISVLDADDRVAGWNKHATRIFKRPEAVLGRDVKDCHPKKSLDKVQTLLREMKAGTRDKAGFWIDLALEPGGEKHKILIEYFALRSADGRYLGCVECSQEISDIQALRGEKRLLD